MPFTSRTALESIYCYNLFVTCVCESIMTVIFVINLESLHNLQDATYSSSCVRRAHTMFPPNIFQRTIDCVSPYVITSQQLSYCYLIKQRRGRWEGLVYRRRSIPPCCCVFGPWNVAVRWIWCNSSRQYSGKVPRLYIHDVHVYCFSICKLYKHDTENPLLYHTLQGRETRPGGLRCRQADVISSAADIICGVRWLPK